jgi:hypothetical protein
MPASATRLPFSAIRSFDVGAGRDIYLRAIGALNATAERVVFLDDSGANVAGAAGSRECRVSAAQDCGVDGLCATLGLIGDASTAPLIGDFHRINPV